MPPTTEGYYQTQLNDLKEIVDDTHNMIQELHKTVLGNGDIEKGLCWRLRMVEEALKPDRDKAGNIIDRRQNPPSPVVKANDGINWGKILTTVISWLCVMGLTGIGLLIYDWLQSI